MAFNNPLPTLREEYLKKKRNKKLLKYGIVLFLFIIILGIFAYITHRPELNISKVELTGGVLVTQPEVETRTEEYLQGAYLWVFPVRFALWYPEGQLEKYLKESFKRIDTISIGLKNFHTLSIEITERKPYAIWCGQSPEVSAGDSSPRCYFMDSNSAIFAEAPNFSGDAYFKYYGLVDSENPIGQYYMSSSTQFLGIASLVSSASKLSLRPQYLIAKGDGEFSLVISGGGQIYFDTTKPIENTISNLEALLRTSVLSTSTSHDLPVDYIDLRFGNKLFYKLK